MEQNQEKEKELNRSYKLFNNVFKLIKGVMKEETYHSLINHIDNHLESSKMRETMIVDDNDEQFFKKNIKGMNQKLFLKMNEMMATLYKDDAFMPRKFIVR